MSVRLSAILQAMLVTLIWSLSWVLIKVGLKDVSPLTFAGLRYSLAFAWLLFSALRTPLFQTQLRQLNRSDWQRLVLLGLIFYTLTQGAQFAALAYLPSVTLSLLLNFTPVVVAIMGIIFLAEQPTPRQFAGISIFIVGVMIYFLPVSLPGSQMVGLIIGLIGMLANALSGVFGRSINRTGHLSPLLVTTVSMGTGGLMLLAAGIVLEGIPHLSITTWLIILWLALVHTAFAFTLWNKTMRVLTAIESSVINSTMLIQIAVLAWVFLGESISPRGIAGLMVAACGVFIVQTARFQWSGLIRRGKTPVENLSTSGE